MNFKYMTLPCLKKERAKNLKYNAAEQQIFNKKKKQQTMRCKTVTLIVVFKMLLIAQKHVFFGIHTEKKKKKSVFP